MSASATPTAAPAANVEPTAPQQAAPQSAKPNTATPVVATESQSQKQPEAARSLLDAPEKPVEDKKPDASKEPAKDGPPDKYDLKLGEEPLAPDLAEAFGELAKSAGMSNEKAQAALTKLAAAQEAQSQKQLVQWINKAAAETQADPEFAGSKLEASRVSVARAIKAYGDEGLGALLETPLGKLMVNSKAMWSFLNRVGANVSEDSLTSGPPPGARPADPESRAKKFYATAKG